MTDRITIGTLGDLQRAGCLTGKAGSQPVCVFWSDGAPFALDDRCPGTFCLGRGNSIQSEADCHVVVSEPNAFRRSLAEQMGATLKHIVMFRYFLKRREDVFDMRDEMYKFFEEHEPDLRQHPRPATLLRDVGIDLPDMRIEIEAWAVVPREEA